MCPLLFAQRYVNQLTVSSAAVPTSGAASAGRAATRRTQPQFLCAAKIPSTTTHDQTTRWLRISGGGTCSMVFQ